MKRKLIVKILKEAKENYLEFVNMGLFPGMCMHIQNTLSKHDIYVGYDDIILVIPKYNRIFLRAKYYMDPFWWPISDTQSRIKAFDKLINYYSHPPLKERIINKIKQYGRKCIFWK